MASVKVNPQFRSDADTVLDKFHRFMADVAVERAKAIVHVRTGALRDSIYSTRRTDSVYVIGSNLIYAGIVEYGSSRQNASPYLRPAVDSLRTDPPYYRPDST